MPLPFVIYGYRGSRGKIEVRPASGPLAWVPLPGGAACPAIQPGPGPPEGQKLEPESYGTLMLSLRLPIIPLSVDDLDGLLSELPEEFFCGTSS